MDIPYIFLIYSIYISYDETESCAGWQRVGHADWSDNTSSRQTLQVCARMRYDIGHEGCGWRNKAKTLKNKSQNNKSWFLQFERLEKQKLT